MIKCLGAVLGVSLAVVGSTLLIAGRDRVPRELSPHDLRAIGRAVAEQRSSRFYPLRGLADAPRFLEDGWARMKGVEISRLTDGNVSVQTPTRFGDDYYHFSKTDAGWKCDYVHHTARSRNGVEPGGAEALPH